MWPADRPGRLQMPGPAAPWLPRPRIARHARPPARSALPGAHDALFDASGTRVRSRLEQLTRRPFALLTGALLVLVGLLLSCRSVHQPPVVRPHCPAVRPWPRERDGAPLLGLWDCRPVGGGRRAPGGAALEWWRLRLSRGAAVPARSLCAVRQPRHALGDRPGCQHFNSRSSGAAHQRRQALLMVTGERPVELMSSRSAPDG